MPRNSLDSLSAIADGSVLSLTTKSSFNVDLASGRHSMVYEYAFATGEFSCPLFVTADEGQRKKVDGVQVEGELP